MTRACERTALRAGQRWPALGRKAFFVALLGTFIKTPAEMLDHRTARGGPKLSRRNHPTSILACGLLGTDLEA